MLNFEDIRPYNDDEDHQVVKKLFKVTPLMDMANAYLPELAAGELEKLLLSFKSITEFQSKMICRIIGEVLKV